MNKPYGFSDDETSNGLADPSIKLASDKFRIKAAPSGQQIVQNQLGLTFLWSNLPAEAIELEAHMRAMLLEGYGPKYVRDYMISFGYSINLFQKVFKHMTGVSFDDYMVATGLTPTPGTIPGINYGWGEGKGNSKDEYYFIMPWNLGYAVFCQKGDLERTEVVYTFTLEEARSALEKEVKSPHYFDNPMDPKMLEQKIPLSNLSEPKHTFITANEKFKELDNFIYSNKETMDKKDIKASIISSYKSNDINSKEFLELWNSYGFNKKAEGELPPSSEIIGDPVTQQKTERINQEVMDVADKQMEQPFKNVINDDTPNQIFDQIKEDSKKTSMVPELTKQIYDYINKKNDSLSDFSVKVIALVQKNVDMDKELEKDRGAEVGDEEKDFFSSHIVFCVGLKIKDKTNENPEFSKLGLMVFPVIDEEIICADTIEGEDRHIYGFTDEGLRKMFHSSRQ